MNSRLPDKEIVLLGVGHTNAHIVSMWRMHAEAGVRLTCISDHAIATYSGMLPAVLAGQVPEPRMEIDLVRLCAASGARLVIGQVSNLDLKRSEVVFHDRAPLHFDALSIGIGSVPSSVAASQTASSLVAIKPMQTFRQRLTVAVKALEETSQDRPLRIAVVGAGAGGLEILFCLPAFLREHLPQARWSLQLVDASADLRQNLPARMAQLVEQTLQERQIEFLGGRTVERVDDSHLHFSDNATVPADLVLWATSACAPALLGELGLPLDDRGFIETDATLRASISPAIFAVGDTGTIRDSRYAKAGVYAVRQGPVLWKNLLASLKGQALCQYRPQQDFLRLLNLGDGRALAAYRGYARRSTWAWHLKQFIDGRFLDRYQRYQPTMPEPPSSANSDSSSLQEAVPCGGCGGKVGASVLSRVLQRLTEHYPQVASVRLRAAEDVVELETEANTGIVLNTDFFTPPLNDDFTSGRIAALNALSDFYAAGASPTHASAIIALPRGGPSSQEESLFQLLAGACVEFAQANVHLIGGHTIESDAAVVGFTVSGRRGETALRSKGGLREGDELVLTKAVGTGVLLAGHMKAACRSTWYETLLGSMLTSNLQASRVASDSGCRSATDVTGFGLAGHLLEMLDASGLGAIVELNQVPLLPGVRELLDQGVESTLAPSNRQALARIQSEGIPTRNAGLAALFDPQTSGGLLLAVAPADRGELLRQLHRVGLHEAAFIGTVSTASDGEQPLQLR